MVDGRITAIGTYEHLMDSNPAFAKLLVATGPQQEKEEGEQEQPSQNQPALDGPAKGIAGEGKETGTEAQPQLMQEDVKVIDSVP
jgi:hypothetical protein